MTRHPGQPWEDFDLVASAAAFAADVHRKDVRKGTAIPYLSHLWAVASLTLEHGGDDEQVAAAFLHDAVEDGGGRAMLLEIDDRFGPEVARLVEALSDSLTDTTRGEAKAPWAERKQEYLEHLRAADDRVQLVSACDKLHNLRSLVTDCRSLGPIVWTRFNQHDPAQHLWYYNSLISIVSDRIPPALTDELLRAFTRLTELVAANDPDASTPGEP
ncbi:MAG: HD domain-containing protein [Acidimicrobiales bacterium]